MIFHFSFKIGKINYPKSIRNNSNILLENYSLSLLLDLEYVIFLIYINNI
jgi:hypothetical protein